MGDVVPLHDETPEQAAAEREAGELPKDVDPCTDLANAYRLAAMHGGDLLFARSLGWLAWDGRRYLLDETGEAQRRAQDVARAVKRQGLNLFVRGTKTDNDKLTKDGQRLLGWASHSQQERALRAALKVAESAERFVVRPQQLDQHLMLLNAANGTVDLERGELLEHDRKRKQTKLAPAEYSSTRGCPRWLAFLDRIFGGNKELIGFVQRAFGYSLTGRTDEQCFFLLWGTGANGKSTLLEMLRHVAGDYALNISADTLMTQRGGRGPENDVARLRGARLVTASESGETRRLDEERVKRLTGGDIYTARFLHREFFEFRPLFKLWLAANAKPEIRGTDHAIWRRVKLIPFEVTIPDDEQDPDLLDKLKEEAAGVLYWAVQGCLDWRRGGLRAPAEVTDATKEYRDEQDALGRFLEDECTILEQAQVATGALYTRYAEWCREQGEQAMDAKALHGRLKNDHGFRPSRTGKRGRFWRGIGLRARDEDPRGGDA
jgi:putative DNA primase/helicase